MTEPSSPTPRSSPLEPWSSAALHILGWLPAAAMCFYAKHRLLEMHGYRIAARGIGRLGADDLTSGERLSFYREDALILLVVAPWLLLVTLRYLRPWTRSIVSGLVGLSVFLISFLQLRTFNELGHFGTFPMLGDFLASLGDDVGITSRFLDPRTVLKIVLPCTMILFLAWAAGQFDPRREMGLRLRTTTRKAGRVFLLILMPLLVAGTTLSFSHGLAPTPYHDSVLLRVLATLNGPTPVDASEFSRLTDPEMHAVYRDISSTPDPRLFPQYFGTAADQDVIVFVTPAVSAGRLDLGGDLEQMPTLRFLRERALVGLRHHAPDPSTSRALFSMYSSVYPTHPPTNLYQRFPRERLEALPWMAAGHGYKTALYSSAPRGSETRERLNQALGFQQVVGARPDGHPTDIESIVEVDRKALLDMLADVTRSIDAGERYMFAFHAQLRHAGQPGAEASGPLSADEVLAMQDRWLGHVVTLLRKKDKLDDTLIVFTSDHGVLTKGTRLDAETYQVPFLLWAPGAIEQTVRIPWVSSHIDVAPTLTHLLGFPPGAPAQGLPIWDAGLQDRTTFFFGSHELGADGYHARGRMTMHAPVSREVYRTSGALQFDEQDAIAFGSPKHIEAIKVLRHMTGLQELWVRHFSQKRHENP